MWEDSQAKLLAGKKATDEFISDGIGFSVHWGIYSLLGMGEWVMHSERIPVREYEKLMNKFNPLI